MSGEYNLKQYKEAKALLPQIDAILRVINLSIKALGFYKSYIPVEKILKVMHEQRMLLEAHQNKYKKIHENKGRVL